MGGEGVLGVKDTSSTRQGPLGELSEEEFGAVDEIGNELGHLKVGHVPSRSFLPAQRLLNLVPHAVLPGQVVLFHALVVVSLSHSSNSSRAEGSKSSVDDFAHLAELFISTVTNCFQAS